MPSPPHYSDTTDGIDEKIIHALQIAPRASFHRISSVLGLPERTVARRYRRLRRDGLIRVTVLVAPTALGGSAHHVRARCRPGTVTELTTSLSRSEDISWIQVHDGGHSIQFSLRSRRPLEETLTSLFPPAGPAVDVSTATVLHRFIGSAPDDWTSWSTDALSAEQTAALTPADTSSTGPRAASDSSATRPPSPLTGADHRMIAHLTADGRTPYSRLARILGTTAGTVTRRIESLLESGVIYYDIDIAPAVTGRWPVFLQLRAAPDRIDAAGRALAARPHVPFAAAVSGPDNLVASVMTTGPEDLYRFITTDVASIDGVTGYSTGIPDRLVKTAGAVLAGDRLAPPRAPRG